MTFFSLLWVDKIAWLFMGSLQEKGSLTCLEHALQLGGVLKATCLLQLGDHGGLCVVAGRHVLNQPLGKHLRVELLEDILVFYVLKYNHLQGTYVSKLVSLFYKP